MPQTKIPLAHGATGADDLQELMDHPFFEGISWDTLRSSTAPTPAPLRSHSDELDGLDWEMTSLAADHAGMPQYEYVQEGTAV